MKEKENTAMMPLQPYIVLQAEKYKRLQMPEGGISHFYEFTISSTHSHMIEAVPDGSIDLLFNFGESGVHTYISGTVFGAKPWELGEEKNCFGVRFLPGEGVLPKGLSMDMLVNQDIELINDDYGKCLAEQIAGADDITERAKIFQRAYEALVDSKGKADIKRNVERYICNRIWMLNGKISIGELAEETHYSPCYIRRIFKQYHGISPKQFAQFMRFQHLLQELKKSQCQLDEAALECGYYDEPHMIKEFKNYTGVTPEHFCNMIQERLALM